MNRTSTAPFEHRREHREEDESQIAVNIALGVAQGDKVAENQLYTRYAPGVLWLLKRKCNGDEAQAWDLTHDTMLTALGKLRQGAIEEPAKLAAFLHGIARMRWLGEGRKERRRGTSADSDLVDRALDAEGNPETLVSRNQVAAFVRVVLAELPQERDRAILREVFLEELSRGEVARSHGLTQDHVNRVLYRAKHRFRELLAARDPGMT